jgi:hypothetical protein
MLHNALQHRVLLAGRRLASAPGSAGIPHRPPLKEVQAQPKSSNKDHTTLLYKRACQNTQHVPAPSLIRRGALQDVYEQLCRGNRMQGGRRNSWSTRWQWAPQCRRRRCRQRPQLRGGCRALAPHWPRGLSGAASGVYTAVASPALSPSRCAHPSPGRCGHTGQHRCWGSGAAAPTATAPSPQNPQVGHEGCVNHCSYNAAGSLLVSGSDDERLCVWDALGDAPLRRPRCAWGRCAVPPAGDLVRAETFCQKTGPSRCGGACVGALRRGPADVMMAQQR